MDRRQAMLSAVAAPLALFTGKKETTSTPKIVIHFVYSILWGTSTFRPCSHLDNDGRFLGVVEFDHVPLSPFRPRHSNRYPNDFFIKWKRNGYESDKTLVILKGTYTAEKMVKELNMQCCPVHDCIKFVVRDGKCVPIAV